MLRGYVAGTTTVLQRVAPVTRIPRPNMSVDEVADLLYGLLSPDLYTPSSARQTTNRRCVDPRSLAPLAP
jgi:hypothetical protein